MTDKKEMVSVPRELLEKVEKSWRVPDGCPNSIWDYVNIVIRTGLEELREILAAPAEDVRAVVDEPVLFVALDAIDDPEQVGMHGTRKPNAVQTVPLYLRPQRPVVMPERCLNDEHGEEFDIGWNACLDEFARLNPEIKK